MTIAQDVKRQIKALDLHAARRVARNRCTLHQDDEAYIQNGWGASHVWTFADGSTRFTRVRDLPTCEPIGAQLCGCGGWRIWFDCEDCIASRYYSHVLRLFPKATWRYSAKPRCFYATHRSQVIAVVMPFKTDMPNGIAGLMAKRRTAIDNARAKGGDNGR